MMTTSRAGQVELKDRSFSRKMIRAGHHLIELNEILAAYSDRHPYEVRKTQHRKRKYTHRFHLTEEPPADVPLIVGDILYNLRSGFDHLIGALVPRSQRSKVLFPLLTEPLWDIPPSDGENEDTKNARRRWESLTR